jgi:hypothetical protein
VVLREPWIKHHVLLGFAAATDARREMLKGTRDDMYKKNALFIFHIKKHTIS